MFNGGSHKETIAAYEAQLRSTKELLEIQAQEALRSGEHVVVLNGEIDILRRALGEKQEYILNMQATLQTKMDLVDELYKNLDQSRIDRLAFYTLEKQNEHLLEKLKEKQQKITELEVEVRFLNQRQDDNALVETTKASRLNELEIIGPYERTILSVQLEQALAKNADLEGKLRSLTAELEQARKAFEWSEATRVDQLARAKQIEYQQLLELGRLDSSFRRLELDTEHLQRANKRESQRGTELQAQLRSSVQTVDQVQQVCGAVIDIVERDDEQLRKREKQLIKQNIRLQEENQLLGAALSSKLRRPRSLASTSPATTSSTSLPLLTSPSRRVQSAGHSSRRAAAMANSRSAQGLARTAPAASSERKGSPPTRKEVSLSLRSSASPPRTVESLAEEISGALVYRESPDKEAALSSSPRDVAPSTTDALRTQMIDRLCVLYLHSARYVLLGEAAASVSRRLSEGLPYEAEQYESYPSSVARTDLFPALSTPIPSSQSSFFSSPPSLAASASFSNTDNRSLPNRSFLSELSLQGMLLQSCDMAHVVNWLRLMPLQVLAVVNLNTNQIGETGWLDLVTWLVSLSIQDLQRRDSPLRIDLTHNRLTEAAIEKGMQLLRSCTDFSLVTLDKEAQSTVVVYGRRPMEDAARRWIAIDVSEQRKRPRSSKTLSVQFKSPIVALSDVTTNSGRVTSPTALPGTSPRPLDDDLWP